MARSIVRGTPYTHVKVGGLEGARAGEPKGADGQTTVKQYRGTGMSTAQSSRGTEYHSVNGNPADARREVSRSTNTESSDHGNQNDPASNGPTTLLDVGPLAGGSVAPLHATTDSPVPQNAPLFEPGWIAEEDRAHLGTGNERGAEGLVAAGGVMSRGMVGTSKSGAGEEELTTDDTLPGVAPAAAVRAQDPTFIVTGKFNK